MGRWGCGKGGREAGSRLVDTEVDRGLIHRLVDG